MMVIHLFTSSVADLDASSMRRGKRGSAALTTQTLKDKFIVALLISIINLWNRNMQFNNSLGRWTLKIEKESTKMRFIHSVTVSLEISSIYPSKSHYVQEAWNLGCSLRTNVKIQSHNQEWFLPSSHNVFTLIPFILYLTMRIRIFSVKLKPVLTCTQCNSTSCCEQLSTFISVLRTYACTSIMDSFAMLKIWKVKRWLQMKHRSSDTGHIQLNFR